LVEIQNRELDNLEKMIEVNYKKYVKDIDKNKDRPSE